ncbi:MAG: hypothetical protein U5O16_03350 [Rhodococcus sp. (in: high G+C Gram-positive bacteria)]|uniref:hypothetical protein n=1 Tax=Rhodococcus sp. TaxID=1831 RepID=UPI002ADB24DA|nr:hypothetical protein [Rhodococcus sp. (in: high G+C Gram-positive bacteria)]
MRTRSRRHTRGDVDADAVQVTESLLTVESADACSGRRSADGHRGARRSFADKSDGVQVKGNIENAASVVNQTLNPVRSAIRHSRQSWTRLC